MWYFKKYEYVIGYEILNTKINTFFLKISRTQPVTTLGYTRIALRLKYCSSCFQWIKDKTNNKQYYVIIYLWIMDYSIIIKLMYICVWFLLITITCSSSSNKEKKKTCSSNKNPWFHIPDARLHILVESRKKFDLENKKFIITTTKKKNTNLYAPKNITLATRLDKRIYLCQIL